MQEEVISEVKQRAKTLTEDNFFAPTRNDYLIVENAVLIGVQIGIEAATKNTLKNLTGK